jgi:hypothetical protein
MKKTITLPVWDRPEYTEKVLKSLEKTNTKGYELLIGIEPGCDKVLEIAEKFAGRKILPTKIILNKERKGIDYNNLNLYEEAFNSGSAFNIAIEDDIVISKDALDLANWFLKYKNNKDYLLLNFFNKSFDYKMPLVLKETNSFCPWGFCFTKGSYEKWIKPNWMYHPFNLNLILHKVSGGKVGKNIGWDCSVFKILIKNNLKTLTPVLSRSKNIGRKNGYHCTPELFDKQFPKNLVCSKGSYGKKFKVSFT